MEIGDWVLISVIVFGVSAILYMGRAHIFNASQSEVAEKDPAPEENVPMTSDRKAQVELYIRSGLYDREYVLDYFCGDDAWPECLEPDEVAPLVEAGLAQLAQEKPTWPDVTDCDRLDAAYAAMWARGIIALHNAGYTQSDGFSDCGEIYHDLKEEMEIVGCCFYQEQDLEGALGGDGLRLAFGTYADEGHDGATIAVGKVVCEELERAGLTVEWDGTADSRPHVSGFVWQRREPLEEGD